MLHRVPVEQRVLEPAIDLRTAVLPAVPSAEQEHSAPGGPTLSAARTIVERLNPSETTPEQLQEQSRLLRRLQDLVGGAAQTEALPGLAGCMSWQIAGCCQPSYDLNSVLYRPEADLLLVSGRAEAEQLNSRGGRDLKAVCRDSSAGGKLVGYLEERSAGILRGADRTLKYMKFKPDQLQRLRLDNVISEFEADAAAEISPDGSQFLLARGRELSVLTRGLLGEERSELWEFEHEILELRANLEQGLAVVMDRGGLHFLTLDTNALWPGSFVKLGSIRFAKNAESELPGRAAAGAISPDGKWAAVLEREAQGAECLKLIELPKVTRPPRPPAWQCWLGLAPIPGPERLEPQQVLSVSCPGESVNCFSFSPDGQSLAAGGGYQHSRPGWKQDPDRGWFTISALGRDDRGAAAGVRRGGEFDEPVVSVSIGSDPGRAAVAGRSRLVVLEEEV